MSDFPVLRRAELTEDPMETVRRWVDAAEADPRIEGASVGCLSTVGANGVPDGRMVVLRAVRPDGVVVCTHLLSAKARQMDATGLAAVVLFWSPVMRQIRLQGTVTRISDGQADELFTQLSRGSQIAAWASNQTDAVDDRRELVQRFGAAAARFDPDVPRPDLWGGYRLEPRTVELWQGHPLDGTHDRFRYQRVEGGWRIERILP
jgi:pyridoxamine 5'-phosphate oxidase